MDKKEFEPTIVQDGDQVKKEFAQHWGSSYFNIFNGKAYVDFVGIILKKNEILFSFPKHFSFGELSSKEKSYAMKEILFLITKGISFNFSKNSNNAFPIDSYLMIQDYYKQYGLHFVTTRLYVQGYDGHIDWHRTIGKSDKIIQNNGVIYLPFVTIKFRKNYEFIAECMEFVLNYVYQRLSKYLNFLTPYSKKIRNPIFSNSTRCVKELKKNKNYFFKDIEKKLIDALINFFEWEASHSDNISIVTTHFEIYWESMIELYLNYKFVGFKNNNEIEWGEEGVGLGNFTKPEPYFIEDEEVIKSKNNTPWKIEFDHFFIDKDAKKIYLLDSKYIYKDGFSSFNYKQAFYYYFLKQYYGNEYKIYNGLIAPTSQEYHHKIHVNRANRPLEFQNYDDGLLIYEHYVNLNEVIKFTKNHLVEFRQKMYANK